MSTFDDATRVERLRPGRYAFSFTEEWFGLRGPHGGFLCAVLLRAIAAEVGDAARHPRSLTVHFPAAAAVGPVEIEVREERRGKRLSTVSVRMSQGGAPMALGLAALSAGRESPEFLDIALPEVPAPEDVPAREPRLRGFPQQFEYRNVIGQISAEGAPADTGGWMRFRQPATLDAPAVACLSDAWLPAIFSRIGGQWLAPTVDLTVHFREEFPVRGLETGDFVFGRFRSQRLERGFWEEDGEIWTRDGRLLAQSRQLALALPARAD